jgi:hypothetical protein
MKLVEAEGIWIIILTSSPYTPAPCFHRREDRAHGLAEHRPDVCGDSTGHGKFRSGFGIQIWLQGSKNPIQRLQAHRTGIAKTGLSEKTLKIFVVPIDITSRM